LQSYLANRHNDLPGKIATQAIEELPALLSGVILEKVPDHFLFFIMQLLAGHGVLMDGFYFPGDQELTEHRGPSKE
jgi:hypothetical protein